MPRLRVARLAHGPQQRLKSLNPKPPKGVRLGFARDAHPRAAWATAQSVESAAGWQEPGNAGALII